MRFWLNLTKQWGFEYQTCLVFKLLNQICFRTWAHHSLTLLFYKFYHNFCEIVFFDFSSIWAQKAHLTNKFSISIEIFFCIIFCPNSQACRLIWGIYISCFYRLCCQLDLKGPTHNANKSWIINCLLLLNLKYCLYLRHKRSKGYNLCNGLDVMNRTSSVSLS